MGTYTIRNLTTDSEIYTSNAYLLSPYSRYPDSNVMIDVGCDPEILGSLRQISTETENPPVSHIILTHNHYDHTQMLMPIKEAYHARVYAISPYASGIDQVLVSGDILHIGNHYLEIIHIPGHSTDSLCVYLPDDCVLFSGDTPIPIWGTEGTYEPLFVRAFERLCEWNIQKIYPGHGDPFLSGCNVLLRESLQNLHKSRILGNRE